jgi:uncharacterized membrane protein YkoI
MGSVERLALATVFALTLAQGTVCAEEAGHPGHAGSEHVCLDQKERRTELDSGRLIRLSAAMHAAKTRMPGTVVRARLCHGRDGLVYVLTVLGHDGKVARIAVDAVKGTFVGGL